MTIGSQSKPNNLLQKIGTILTGPAETVSSPPAVLSRRAQPDAINVEIMPPFAVLTSFEDYAADGEEPADLALLDLIPAELAELNLPYGQSNAGQTDASEQAFGLCLDRPLTEAEKIAAEMADFTPVGLSSLNIPFQQLAPATADSIKIEHSTASQDLASSTALSQTRDQPFAATIRIPTQYLDQLNSIVTELNDQQNRQARHNEQLGVLIKQLLSRVTHQQKQLNALGLDTQNDLQTLIQTCLFTTDGIDDSLAA